MVIIVGKGHSGTRIPSKLLVLNGYRTGKLNQSFDLVPPEKMYEAVKEYSKKNVKFLKPFEWSFDNHSEPSEYFKKLIKEYLEDVLNKDKNYFKIPETTLCYPWIVKMFPNAHYIHWIRDPRDFSPHISDLLDNWGIPTTNNIKNIKKYRNRRRLSAISSKYQWDIVESTPKPKNFLRIKYEDYCLDQKKELEKINFFLKDDLNPIEVRTDKVQKWKKDILSQEYPFLSKIIKNNYN